MELIAAIALAGPLGYFVRSRPLLAYLAAWAVIFPVQTAVVHAEDAGDINAVYFIVNAAILVGGVELNKLGTRLRRKRAAAA